MAQLLISNSLMPSKVLKQYSELDIAAQEVQLPMLRNDYRCKSLEDARLSVANAAPEVRTLSSELLATVSRKLVRRAEVI